MYDKKQILDIVIYGQGQSQLILIGYTPPCPEADISTYKAESLWNLKKAKIVKEANI